MMRLARPGADATVEYHFVDEPRRFAGTGHKLTRLDPLKYP
jgi:hypothetical protein